MKRLKIFPVLSILLFTAGCSGSSERTTDTFVDSAESSTSPQVAVLVTNGFHGEEAYIPIGHLVNKGVEITVIGPETGRVESWDKKYNIVIEKSLSDVRVDDFDALIIPGGSAPARLRDEPEAMQFTIDFFNSGKTVASICHGPQLLAATGVLQGVRATGVADIREEMEAAGATYVDEAVTIYKNLITSREPEDIPLFIEAIENALM